MQSSTLFSKHYDLDSSQGKKEPAAGKRPSAGAGVWGRAPIKEEIEERQIRSRITSNEIEATRWKQRD